MANLAGGWQVCGDVIGTRRGVVGRHVAPRASCRQCGVVIVDVAGGTGRGYVRTRQWKLGVVMIE